MLYGYQVVVAGQQQQSAPPPPQQHHGYSKRKKKKYQRRKQVDIQGSYLDPQLYTGEPFVAAPGGYVVPLDPSASVCQVHGIQYVTPAFQQQVDEGFVSVQHSPYLPNSAVEPNASPSQPTESSSSQEDSTRTVFSDLQDTERQQIQEILLQERAKVGKSDSTESSDSGVSESEETPAPDTSPSPLLRQEEASQEERQPQTATQGNASEETVIDSTAKQSIITGDYIGVQDRIIDDQLSTKVEVDENLEVTQSKIHTAKSINVDSKHTNQSSVEDERCSEGVSLDTVLVAANSDTNNCDSYLEGKSNSLKPQTVQAHEVRDELNKGKDVYHDEITENNLTTIAIPSACSNFVQHSVDTLPLSEIQEVAQETIVVKCLKTKTESCDEVVNRTNRSLITSNDNHRKDVIEQIICTSNSPLLQQSEDKNQSSSEESRLNTQSSQGQVVQIEKCTAEASECPKDANEILDGGTKEESLDPAETNSTINQGTLKDLKVTEAVKRWIREVSPEKAFTLSEEVQSLLLAEQESIVDMDTDDEYIEDEISEDAKSTIVLESKNVKGNPFVAASSDSLNLGMEGCSKRVAFMNEFCGTTPDALDEYDGASTVSNLSYDQLYSEASSSHTASINHSFDEVDKYIQNPEMYNPCAYTKYYQLGVQMDETTLTATSPPGRGVRSREHTPSPHSISGNVSECGSEDVDNIPHKYDVAKQHTQTSPMSLATEILKAEKILSNMAHIFGSQDAVAHRSLEHPDKYLKHYDAISGEVRDSGVQSEESSDETEAHSNVSSSGVGSSLASTPAISPAHHSGKPILYPHPLRHISTGECPVPCKTVCCAVM